MSSLPTQQNIFALEGAQSSNAIANQQENEVVEQLMLEIHQGEQNQMLLLAKLEKLENDKSNENTADEQEKLSISLNNRNFGKGRPIPRKRESRFTKCASSASARHAKNARKK